jgi:ribosomal protein L29
VIGALKIKKKQLNQRGEEIVDVKEKLTNYLSQVSLKNFDNPEFITKNEAKRERRRIERLFTYETDI